MTAGGSGVPGVWGQCHAGLWRPLGGEGWLSWAWGGVRHGGPEQRGDITEVTRETPHSVNVLRTPKSLCLCMLCL